MLWVVGSGGIGAGIYLKVKPSYEAYSIIRVDPAANESLRRPDQRRGLRPVPLDPGEPDHQPERPDRRRGRPQGGRPPPDPGRPATSSRNSARSSWSSVIPDTYLIEVSMISDDSYEAAILVNAVVDAFIKSNEEFTDGMSKTQIKSLDNYLSDLKNQTDELEVKWKELVAKGDLDTQLGIEINKRLEQRKQGDRPAAAQADGARAGASRSRNTSRSARNSSRSTSSCPGPGLARHRQGRRRQDRRPSEGPAGGRRRRSDRAADRAAVPRRPRGRQLASRRCWRPRTSSTTPADHRQGGRPGGSGRPAASSTRSSEQFNDLWASKYRTFREEIEQIGGDGPPRCRPRPGNPRGGREGRGARGPSRRR